VLAVALQSEAFEAFEAVEPLGEVGPSLGWVR